VTEATTRSLQNIAAADTAMLVWWGTQVECASAVARLEREGALEPPGLIEAFNRLVHLTDGWHEVDSLERCGTGGAAVRFLRVHPLRAADALQLGAAFVAAERRRNCS
jgi:hypothetical protein